MSLKAILGRREPWIRMEGMTMTILSNAFEARLELTFGNEREHGT